MKELELKLQGKIERLTNETFRFDSRIGEGWYTANYFLKTCAIVEKKYPNHQVTIQFFTRDDAIVCGLDEAIAIIFTFAKNPDKLIVEALKDGDKIKPMEPVLKITGHYQDFGFLENVIDGILARRSSIATNVYRIFNQCNPKGIIFMGDRDDHYINQAGDGYSAYIGGVAAQVTMAMNEWWGKEGIGTMPHALIQICQGDIIEACESYLSLYPDEPLTALIDYNNNVIEDSLKVARHFKNRLNSVRVDTSKSLIDHYFDDKKDQFPADEIFGCNPHLIKALRQALDKEGFGHVKIIVSSGFDEKKIAWFKKHNAPVDFYGIGSSLLKIHLGFTGDLVRLNGKKQAKVGREEIENKRLEKVKYYY